MAEFIAINKWLNRSSESIDPREIRFKAVVARPVCKGCLFERESVAICNAAVAIAKENGFPDCDDQAQDGGRYIYVVDKSDPRQMRITRSEAAADATATASITESQNRGNP